MMLIPFRGGEIYADGDDCLRVDINGRWYMAAAIGRLEGIELVQDGDHEKTFRFHASQFEKVVEIVKPYRKRQISGDTKQRLHMMGFGCHMHAGTESLFQERPQTPQPDSEHPFSQSSDLRSLRCF